MLELNKKEEVKTIKRRHIIILKLELLPLIGLALALIIFMIVFPFYFEVPEWFSVFEEYVGSLNPLFLIFFLSFAFLFVLWQIAFFLTAGYYLDAWIITDQRTIHTELNGLFSRYISSIYHNRIQDVSVDVGGVLATYLNYGNLQIQTAGKFREFLFKQIPDPYETKKLIMEVQRDFLKRRKKRSKKEKSDKYDDF